LNRNQITGFKLEKRQDFILPIPNVGNNFYKNHSQIPVSCIFRKFKGPLYNEAGKMCIELT
jgi:hypothetical protein